MSGLTGKRGILAATIGGSSLAFLDGSVVNVALPGIQRQLGASAGAIAWVVDGYLLLLGALVLIGGAAADRFGRRRVFLYGVAGFTASSIGCALAPNAEMLVVARVVQGVAAALLTPASLAILGANFSDEERGRAVGLWAGVGTLTAALGPVLGGWLVDAVSWRAIFLINVPIAIVTWIVTMRSVPESRAHDAKSLDLPGAALAASGLGLVAWGLTRAGESGFSDLRVDLACAIGAALLAIFGVVEARSKAPMVPFALFRSRAFAGANALTLLLYFALGAAFFFLPFELVRARGFSARNAGASLLPLALIMGTMSGFAGKLADRVGARIPLTVGPIVAGVGFVLLSFLTSATSYWTGLFPAVVVLAVGMTLSVAPLTTTVMSGVGTEHAGTASGVNNAIARVAGLLAIAIASLVFSARFDASIARSFEGEMDKARPARGAGLTVHPLTDAPEIRAREEAAFEAAYRSVMLLAAACAALGGVAAGIILPSRPRPSAEAHAAR